MKKSIVVSVILGLLILIICGGSWYTGTQVEKHYLNFIKNTNYQLRRFSNDNGLQGEITDIEFKRGFFSSEVKYRLNLKLNSNSFELKVNDILYHGPLPLNRLEKLNLMPVIASINSNLIQENNTITKGELDFTYSNFIDGNLAIDEIKIDNENLFLDMSKMAIDYKYELSKNNFDVTLNLDKAEWQNENDKIELQNVSYHFKSNKDYSHYPNLYLGNHQGKISGIINGELTLKDIDWKFLGKENNQILFSDVYFSIKDIVSDKVSSGTFNFKADLQTDAKEADNYVKYLANKDKHLAMKSLQNILKLGLKLNIEDISLSHNNHRAGASVKLDVDNFDLNKLNESLYKVKQFNLNAELNRGYAEYLISTLSSTGTQEERELSAKNDVNALFSTAKDYTFLQVDDNKISFKLDLEQGQVNLNNTPLSQSELQGILFMLMLNGFAF